MLYATHRDVRAHDLALAMTLMLVGCAAERDDDPAPLSAEQTGRLSMEVAMDASVLPAGGRDAGTGVDATADKGWWIPPINWLRNTVAGSPIVALDGAGCPGTTGTASLAADGNSVTIVFDALEARVQPNQSFATKSCYLAIKLRSTEPYTYAVSEALLQGHAQLASGQSANVEVRHYSAGTPALQPPPRHLLRGPFDGPFALGETIPASDQVWAPCGLDRQLNVHARITLRNDPRTEGVVSLAPSASAPDAKLYVSLVFRRCK